MASPWMASPRAAWLMFFFVLGYAFLLRIFDLDARLNPDADLWLTRTTRFWGALERREWSKMWQSPHPGITYMWLCGLFQRGFGLEHTALSPELLRAAKLPVVLVSSVSCAAVFALLRRLFGPRLSGWALFASLVLSSEPFVVAHSRSLHLDMLVTSLGFLAVLTQITAIREYSYRWSAMSGALWAAAVFSKASAAMVAAGAMILYIANFVRDPRGARSRLVGCLLVAVLCAFVVAGALLPELLFDPKTVLERFFTGVTGLAEGGHRSFAWGKSYAKDPGPGLYAAAVLLRTSPEVLAGVITFVILSGVFAVFEARSGHSQQSSLPMRRIGWSCLVAYSMWGLTLLASSKKGARYFVTMLPMFCVVATAGIGSLWLALRSRLGSCDSIRSRISIVAFVVVCSFFCLRTIRIVAFHPLPLAWTARLPGLSPEETLVLGWGEGLREAALWIGADARRLDPESGGVVPAVHFPGYGKTMRPWLHFRSVSALRAEYVVDYLCNRQRRRDRHRPPAGASGTPLHRVHLNAIEYVTIYPGPAYRRARASR